MGTCAICGAAFQRPDARTKYCGVECRRLARREQGRASREAHPERHREYSRRHHRLHQEKRREHSRRYHDANREAIRERKRRYREANPDVVLGYGRRWRRKHPGFGPAYRALKRAAFVETVEPRAVFERDGWRCQLCRRVIHRHLTYPHPGSASLDHILPLARGGTHEYRNVQAAHLRCNKRKQARVLGAGEQLRLIA